MSTPREGHLRGGGFSRGNAAPSQNFWEQLSTHHNTIVLTNSP